MVCCFEKAKTSVAIKGRNKVIPCTTLVCTKAAAIRAATRELMQTTTTTVTRTSPNKRFNEQNHSCALALYIFVHFFAVLCKTTT